MLNARNVFLFIFILFLVCAAVNCTKQNQQSLTITEGVLSVGVEVGYPPMEYYDTDGVTLTGFDIELTKALAEKLELKVNYIDVAWEGILAGLDTDKFDIAVNITILPERQDKYNFTKPYIDSSMTIVALKDSLIKIETPKDITGLKAAYQSDTTAQYFTENLKNQGVTFTSFSYDKITNCFTDLGLKRLDLVVVDNIVAFDYAGKEDSVFEIIWQGPSNEYIGICLKKGNDALTAALNNALDELFADGTTAGISKKYFKYDLVSSLWN